MKFHSALKNGRSSGFHGFHWYSSPWQPSPAGANLDASAMCRLCGCCFNSDFCVALLVSLVGLLFGINLTSTAQTQSLW